MASAVFATTCSSLARDAALMHWPPVFAEIAVVAEVLPASRREYIRGGCKQVREHRAQLANKRLRFAPEGCDSGPTHPHV
eukprot:27890-Chlamydomonas_euryale.AAC.1